MDEYDRFGFSTRPDESLTKEQQRQQRAPSTPVPEIERMLQHKWERVLGEADWSHMTTKIHNLVAEGIPEKFRGKIWTRLTRSDELCEEYRQLVAQPDPPSVTQIKLDLPRTLPRHQLFCESGSTGQRRLLNVLKAYSLKNPTIGYCQGMSYLAAILLTQMDDDAEVYCAFCRLVGGCEEYYSKTMSELLEDGKIFQLMIDHELQSVSHHLNESGIVNLMYLSKWFMTSFVQSGLPWDAVLRITDMHICEGKKALFRFGYAVLLHHKRALLAMSGIERILPFLLDLSSIPSNVLVPLACRVPIDTFLRSAVKRFMEPTENEPPAERPSLPMPKKQRTVFDSLLDSIATPVRQAVKRKFTGEPTPSPRAPRRRTALGVLSPGSPMMNSPNTRKRKGIFNGLDVRREIAM